MRNMQDAHLLIQGASALVHQQHTGEEWMVTDAMLAGSRIEQLSSPLQNRRCFDSAVFDASNLLLLPGIVDLHGDAFERQLQPRPYTAFAHDIALADTDRQLVANGITTAYHGVTYSWEGGLRGREAAVAMLEHVNQQRHRACADHRIHLRFETHHADGVADALRWIAEGKVDFLAFNDHLPSIAAKSAQPEKLATYAERARCSGKIFKERLQYAQSRDECVWDNITALAGACHQYGVPMASHDDQSCSDRERFDTLGVGISEFPRTQDALFTAMALDNLVVLGAPNVLLGGSHSGSLATIDAVRSRMCDIMASDYYYPSLLHAPFKLAHLGACSLAEAWRLVAENPARALGLKDRGVIAEGCRADLLLVEAATDGTVRLVATIAAGKLVYCAEPERMMAHFPYRMTA